mmetsp:Transcript_66758/g.159671  ORF Transcript_66758/g.159671 Transcript_66758/m.159671 type:complete len:495 (-) Transcript_66758:227-1711(-)
MSVNLLIKFVRQGTASETQREVSVDFESTRTVEELKEQIASQFELPKDHIRLVCAGRVWENAASVGSYSPADGATVYCLNNPPRQMPASSQQTLQQVNPLQDMMGGLPPVSNSGDPFEQMMAQTQRQMMQNPEMMQSIMSQPAVQSMLSDPETLRAMMRMNPRLNQLMESRPEIARLLDDPATLQQSMQLMANPSLMREMTRNADRALGQLDAMPGGHEALLRAHEDYLDPLYNAMTGSEDGSAAELPTYTQQTQGAPNTAALPNPWGPAPAAATSANPAPAADASNAQAARPPSAATPAPAANPFLAMMQQQQQQPAFPMFPPAAGQQNTPPAFGAPAAGGGMGGGSNPFEGMMQMMMQNPAAMQQMMNMSRQMMGGMPAGGMGMGPMGFGMPGMGGDASAGNMTAPAATPAAAPTATTTPTATPAPTLGAPDSAAAQAPMLAMQRMRFQSQLAQLASMGFTNEPVCIQALVRHNGRIDAAIETLLTDPSASS